MVTDALSLQDALTSLYGTGCIVDSRRRVSGGDINDAFLLTLSGGRRVFLKENRSSLAEMFKAEAEGLRALGNVASRSDAPPVPEPLAWGVDGNRAFLLMEEVSPGRLAAGTAFGRSLAILHREGRRESCGFDRDNWIGSTPQPNPDTLSWHEFFAEHRLLHQWNLARSRGYGDKADGKLLDSICRRLSELLPDVDDGLPSLVHGDLWGGNWMAGYDGVGRLIDPAVYYGHREADLAMTRLFGGFPAGFHDGYRSEWPLEPGFEKRVELYNLYHILNHLNLFGSSYWGGARHALELYS